MSFCFWKERFALDGNMPERALLRLRREKIPLYRVQKTANNRILFSVRRQDKEKVLTLYPQTGTHAYRVRHLATEGVGKHLTAAWKRIGLVLGGIVGLILVMLSQNLVLSVEFVGSECYKRDALQVLDEVGIRAFSPYQKGQEDLVCAKLLALDGVEFCALKKTGNRLAVEIRLSPFPKVETETGNMQAKHNGEVLAMTVLRGSPHVKIGETVRKGETLVEDHFTTEQGGQVRVEIIARVCIACVWEGEVEAESEEEAFAKAYLVAMLTDHDTLQETTIENNGKTYRVKMIYQAIETMNLWQ
jgi:hypothetical protein